MAEPLDVVCRVPHDWSWWIQFIVSLLAVVMPLLSVWVAYKLGAKQAEKRATADATVRAEERERQAKLAKEADDLLGKRDRIEYERNLAKSYSELIGICRGHDEPAALAKAKGLASMVKALAKSLAQAATADLVIILEKIEHSCKTIIDAQEKHVLQRTVDTMQANLDNFSDVINRQDS